jgi:DNA-binding CsgD family transcriptional regulator
VDSKTRRAGARVDAERIPPVGDRHVVVGRDAELARLRQAWETAQGGDPQVVLVEGAAGVGKSTLVNELLAGVGDVPVLWASGDELEVDLGFGVAAQLLGTDPGELAAGDALAVGARMLQALSDRDQAGPVIVVVDDLGWADLPSMQAMAFAMRRLHSDPVLALLTVRTELRSRVPDSIMRALEGRGGHLVLEGLSGHDLEALVAALGLPPLPSRTLDRLAEHTGGSPLHVRALLDELDPEALAAGDLTPLAAPRSFAELVRRQLAGLGDEPQALVTAAAVVGMRAPVPFVAELAGIDDPTKAIDAASESGLVDVAVLPMHHEIRFVHPLTRAALYHDTSLTVRSRVHRRAAELFDDAGDHPASLRHRAAAVTGTDGALAAEVAAHADAERVRPSGAATAARWYQLAARLATDTATREDLVLRAIESLVLAGDVAGAQELAVALDGFAESARRAYLSGALLLADGQFPPAVQQLEHAWSIADPHAAPDLAGAIAGSLAVVMINTANLDDAVTWAERAVDLSSPGNVLGSSPHSLLPVALAATGRYEEALASPEPVPADDSDIDADGLQRLIGRGTARLWVDDIDGSYDDLTRAVRLGRRAGAFLPYSVATCYLADAEYLLGRWDDALLHAELIASVARDLDQTWFLAIAHGTAALAPANRGDWATAEAHVAAALEVASVQGDAASVMWARTAEATLAVARGDHAAAVIAAEACLAHPGVGRVREPGVKPWRVLGLEACASTGDLDVAQALLDGVDRDFATPSMARARSQGTLAAAAGDHDEAERRFAEAAALLPRCRNPFERARLHLATGAHLRRRGQRRRAVEELNRARELLVALQAGPWIDRVDAELAVSGLHPAARDNRRHVELTPQEQAIVRLVIQGHRNREIAAELFISVKTVEYHLGNAYRKLGVTRRTQLAAALADVQVA